MKEFLGDFSGQEAYRLDDAGDRSIRSFLFVPDGHDHFVGHFDGFPVLPGATQIGIVLDILSCYLERKVKLRKISKARFSGIIVPQTELDITVTFSDPMPNEVTWSIRSGATQFARGVLTYA